MKVIFMATPNFAVPSLKKLIEDPQIEVIAVYTNPPKPAKRGQKILKSPIHNLAIENNLKVFTPKTLKTQEEQDYFKSLNADIALVVAYGLILPKTILESTKFGIINIHPSILPKYRGATPIQSTILAGDDEIGTTIIKMDQGVDSGDIILQNSFKITQEDDYSTLAPRLSQDGAELALEAIKQIRDNKAKFTKQDKNRAILCRKFQKEDARIDFNASTAEILNKIRALSGFLTTFFEYKGQRIKIFKAKEVKTEQNATLQNTAPGQVIDQNFTIKTKDGAIQPLILQKPGKKPTSIRDFLLGFKFD